MTFTANIARKHAEAARRRAREIESTDCSCSRMGSAAFCECHATRTERSECVAIWNTFCREEDTRIELARRRASAGRIVEIIPGCWIGSR